MLQQTPVERVLPVWTQWLERWPTPADLAGASQSEAVRAWESRLRESEERFRTLADQAPVLIWMSGPDAACNYVNAEWLRFTGRPLAEELGIGWSEDVHPDDFAASHWCQAGHQDPSWGVARAVHSSGSIHGPCAGRAAIR